MISPRGTGRCLISTHRSKPNVSFIRNAVHRRPPTTRPSLLSGPRRHRRLLFIQRELHARQHRAAHRITQRQAASLWPAAIRQARLARSDARRLVAGKRAAFAASFSAITAAATAAAVATATVATTAAIAIATALTTATAASAAAAAARERFRARRHRRKNGPARAMHRVPRRHARRPP